MIEIYLAAGMFFLGITALHQFYSSFAEAPLYLKLSRHNKPVKNYASAAKSLISVYQMGKSRRRTNLDLLFELPDFLDLFSVALSSGESVYFALKRVVPRMAGRVSNEFNVVLSGLDYGSDFETELTRLGSENSGNPLGEVANKMLLAIRRGTPLAQMLNGQASFARQELQNQMLLMAGRNETKMLVPLVFLILPVTILFAIFPSLEMLGSTYI